MGGNQYEAEVAVTNLSIESNTADGIMLISLEGISSPNGITIINNPEIEQPLEQKKKPNAMEILTAFQKEVGSIPVRKVTL